MGKISIQDLAQVLVERKGLNKRDAAIFVSAMFDIIQTNLEKDKIVKIKGLGTFKIIDVDDRESVNVNTGERVLIEGHNKITFTPDSLMKELVNKPFSQFETVVLNDGVDFEDMNSVTEPTVEDNDPNDPTNMPLVDFGAEDEQKLSDNADEENSKWVIEPVVKAPERPALTESEVIILGEALKPEPTVEPEPEPIVEPESVAELESEPEPIIEAPEPAPIPEVKSELQVKEDKKFGDHSSKGEQKWFITLLACILCLAGGYVFGNLFPWSQFSQPQNANVEKAVPVSKPVPVAAPMDSVAPVDSVAQSATKPVEPKLAEKPAPAATPTPAAQFDNYEKMDNRVKYGAYRIVGTSQEVKVKEGDNLKEISNRFLGPDMECYVEVYNGMNSKTQLKAGQTIKIPKLEQKKKKSQKKNIKNV